MQMSECEDENKTLSKKLFELFLVNFNNSDYPDLLNEKFSPILLSRSD